MRGAVVVLVEEGAEAYLHVVQRGQAAEVVEAAGAQRAPEPLHLAARRHVVGPSVDQRDAEALAAQPQRDPAVGAAVVEVEAVGRAVAAQRGQKQVEHVDLALGVVGLERDHVARGVVEHCVDAQRSGRRADAQRRAVADVAVPQRAGVVGLPAQPGVAVGAHPALEPGVAVQSRHRRRRHHVGGQPPVGDQRAQDQRQRRGRVLAPDIEQELALLRPQLAGATSVGARCRAQPGEAVGSIRVEPSLQGRGAETSRARVARRPVALGGQRTHRGCQIAAVELAAGQGADDLGTEQGDRLGVVAWAQGLVVGHAEFSGAAG